jgi:hypothetical protein
MPSADICVAYLVWKPLGLSPCKTFIESYRRYQPEISHDLIIIFKGTERDPELDGYRALLDGIDYQELIVPNRGFDIEPYFRTATALDHGYFCFLNTQSELLDSGWLEKLHGVAVRDDVGVVGATGSWESLYTDSFRWIMPWAERSLVPNIPRFIARRARGAILYKGEFPPFPNVHLRTNAFMLRREIMLQLVRPAMRRKLDALRFESGSGSLTRQILAMQRKALVVGRDGKGYEPHEWPESNTFRSGDQVNLLVADKRTAEFGRAGPERRRSLSEVTWGPPPRWIHHRSSQR